MDPDPLSCFLPSIDATINIAQQLTFNIPTTGSIIASVIAILALFLSAFISGSEIAFFSLSTEDCDSIKDSQQGDRILRLLSTPERLLATVLIANNFVNVSIVILCNYIMTQIFVFQSAFISFLFQSVILTFLILLFGEILPKLYATNHNIKFAQFAAPWISFFCTLFSPISKLMVKSTFIVNKIVTKHSDKISMEDLSQALEITNVQANDEKELLEGIIKFGGTTVAEIMKPRIDIEDISYDVDFEKVIEIVIGTGYSRLPVYQDSPDNIKGILYAKDLLPYIGKTDKDFRWQKLLREAYFVPETRMIDDLLEDFRTMKIHMAIVIDEFGGTQGIVTLEDVLEEIVGDINDEYDTEEKFYQKLSNDTYIFTGKTLLNDFYRVTGIEETEFDDICEDADTLAGLLLTIKGDFPDEKESIMCGRCHFSVLEIAKHRITTIRVKILPKAVEK
ncbi:MAG: gliding motility-associated protein GldE [Muribaculaceae bacterium]